MPATPSRDERIEFRMHALEKLTEVLAEAIEEIKPGFGAKAIADIRKWAKQPATVTMLHRDEIDAVLTAFDGAFQQTL